MEQYKCGFRVCLYPANSLQFLQIFFRFLDSITFCYYLLFQHPAFLPGWLIGHIFPLSSSYYLYFSIIFFRFLTFVSQFNLCFCVLIQACTANLFLSHKTTSNLSLVIFLFLLMFLRVGIACPFSIISFKELSNFSNIILSKTWLPEVFALEVHNFCL